MKPAPQVVQIRGPLVIRLSPLGFHRYGKQFLAAELSLRRTRGFSPVPYYLLCRALELLLKSYLLAHNVSISELKNRKKLGHDLIKVLTRAHALGLDNLVRVTPSVEAHLRKANAYYPTKGFEYLKPGHHVQRYPHLPEMRVLRRFASQLVARLEEVCRRAA